MTLATPQPSRVRSWDIRATVSQIARDRRARLGDEPIAPTVLESWERCVRYGLEPGAVSPNQVSVPDADARLIDVVDRALESRLESLHASGVCLSLTDSDGVVLRQWVGDRAIMQNFERMNIVPGFSVAETTIGNSSGSALVTRAPMMVRGPEHFAPQFAALTSAGDVITHPITRRVVGSLNLTCRFADTSPMALSWVCEIVADIERRLLEAATTAEQLLLRRFLEENRDARHAVVAVNAQTAMTNAAAAKLMGHVDQAQLWEYASAKITDAGGPPPTLTLLDGSSLRVHRSAVVGSGDSLGVVLRLARVPESRRQRPEPLPSLPGLAGEGPAWTKMRRRLVRSGERPLLLVGEAGTGKRALARALIGPDLVEIDCSRAERVVSETRAALAVAPTALILLHLDDAQPACAAELGAVLEAVTPATRLLATSRRSSASGAVEPALLDLFNDLVAVPSLSDRPEDIPAIVAEVAQRHAGSRAVHWMPDALHALTRRAWPENVRSLDRLVAHVVATVHRDYVGLRDLPAHVSSRTGRRQLTGLERVEAEAILQALHDSEWNKQEAAEALGIARSTLYRKMQALGIDREASF